MNSSALQTAIPRWAEGCRAGQRVGSLERPGLSLIEVLIILAVLAVIVGLTLPRLDTSRFRADANARLVREAIEESRELARSSGRPVILGFDIAGRRIRIVQDSDANGVSGPGELSEWRALIDGAVFVAPASGIDGVAAAPVEGDSLSTIDDLPSIIIRADGSAGSNLRVYVGTGISSEALTRAITLDGTPQTTRWFRGSAKGWQAAR